MSTITKEFTKEQLIEKLQHRIAVAAKYPDLEEAQFDAAILKIALASLEAEAVAECHHQWKSGGANKLQRQKQCVKCGRVELVAPPAPVAVPDEIESTSGSDYDDYYCDGWNACRAAMLQGAEPVTTAYKLPELTDSQCLEFLAVAFRHASIKGDIEFDDIRLGLKMALEAAPQQEVKP